MFINSIPVVDNVDKLSSVDLDLIKRIGIVYLKLDDSDSKYSFFHTAIREKALSFFRASDEFKKKDSMSVDVDERVSKNLSSGYNDRRSSDEYIETFRHKVGLTPTSPLNNYDDEINSFKNALVDQLSMKLLKKILQSISLNEGCYDSIDQMLDGFGAILSLVYYPKKLFLNDEAHALRLGPHKDIDWVTVMIVDKPGLKFWADGKWINVLPKDGYAVAMFGYDLSILTNGEIRSCLHTVEFSENIERFTMLFFTAPAKLQPFLSRNEELLCVNEKLNSAERYHKHNIETKATARSAFLNVAIKINIVFVASLILLCAYTAKKFDRKEISYSIFFGITSLLALNLILKVFKNTYFENRMLIDYMQYSSQPSHGSKSQLKAYELGENSLSICGIIKSASNCCSYSHASFWNAGFMRSFSEKYSSKSVVVR